MDARFQNLPPLKRLRLMQRDLELAQQQQQEPLQSQPEAKLSKSSKLPGKKRKQSRVDYDDDGENSGPTYRCLPAKKRIWAIDPDLLSGNPFSPFDLNIEYKPCVDEDEIEKNPTLMVESSLQVEEDDNKENIDPLGKGKGLDLSDSKPQDREDCEHEEEVEEDGIMCAVCQSTDGDPLNPIVFCDGCDLMVHASCYGNPLVKAIPEGDWFCRQCVVSRSLKSRDKLLSCCLCTTKGGAMKPTKDGRWAHITCSLFVPEVYFEDPEGREGICCSEIPSKRWKDRCYLCKIRRGCVIECSEMKCQLAFHVTCGLKEDLCIEYREGKKSGGIVVAFCNEHTKLWERQQESGKYKIVARDEDKK